MNKLPVAPAIRFAYAFAFGQLGTIIGLIWAPMVVIAVLRFLPYGLGDTHLAPDQNPAAAGAAALRGVVFGLTSVLLYACINVAVIRQALGLRTGTAIFHFSLGWTELRLFGATLMLALILIVLMMGSILAMLAVGAAVATAANEAVAAAVAIAVGLAGLCVVLVAITRLAFLLVPIVVVENRIGFERGWRLTAGNFWRIASVLFVVTLPTATIFLASFGWLIGREVWALIPVAAKLTQEVLADRIQTIVDSHIATIIGINLIIAPFSVGLALGASAFGYKTLSAAAPPPADTARAA